MTGTCKGFTVGLGIAFLALALQAEAAEIRVKCEKRLNQDGSAERSKISVDAKDLDPGTYTAKVTSGGMTDESQPQTAVGDEVEFDFDSNPNDVEAGAKGIDPDFIQHRVDGSIVDASGDTVVSGLAIICRVKD